MKAKYSKDDTFWNEPNILNSYWAGFIAADGYIDKNNTIEVHLSSIDANHLEKLKTALSYTGNVKVYGKESRLRISNAKQLIEDLEKHFNITTAKSYTLKAPNIIDDELNKAFVLGYIDGDGWVTISTTKPSGRRKTPLVQDILGVVGTESILTHIRTLFNKLVAGNTSIRQRGRIYQYEVKSKRARLLKEIFRKMDVPKLERKWISK